MVTTCMLSLYLPITVIISFPSTNQLINSILFSIKQTFLFELKEESWLMLIVEEMSWAAPSSISSLFFVFDGAWRANKTKMRWMGLPRSTGCLVLRWLLSFFLRRMNSFNFINISLNSFTAVGESNCAPFPFFQLHSFINCFSFVFSSWRSHWRCHRP